MMHVSCAESDWYQHPGVSLSLISPRPDLWIMGMRLSWRMAV
ncbi:UNVERIFIED_CONTAM: hypothetical protein GTU68_055442 [Idotea baltica]|nr:hypothetical protein [Idotea baltica]